MAEPLTVLLFTGVGLALTFGSLPVLGPLTGGTSVVAGLLGTAMIGAALSKGWIFG